MTYREIRIPLFRVATALIFMAAIGFMRTESVYADWRPGDCQQINQTYACTEDSGGSPLCWDQFSCVNVYDDNPPNDLCYCMSETNCGWWPNGCGS